MGPPGELTAVSQVACHVYRDPAMRQTPVIGRCRHSHGQSLSRAGCAQSEPGALQAPSYTWNPPPPSRAPLLPPLQCQTTRTLAGSSRYLCVQQAGGDSALWLDSSADTTDHTWRAAFVSIDATIGCRAAGCIMVISYRCIRTRDFSPLSGESCNIH